MLLHAPKSQLSSQSKLEDEVSKMMSDDNYVGFFLTTLSHHLNSHPGYVLRLQSLAFGSLKAKFIHIATKDFANIQSTNIPLMLNLSFHFRGQLAPDTTEPPLGLVLSIEDVPRMIMAQTSLDLLRHHEVWTAYLEWIVNNKFEPVQQKPTVTGFDIFKKGISSLISKKSDPNNAAEKLEQIRNNAFFQVCMMLGSSKMDTGDKIAILERISRNYKQGTVKEGISFVQSIPDYLSELGAKRTIGNSPHSDSLEPHNFLTRQSLAAEDNGALYMRIIDQRLREFETAQRVIAEIMSQGGKLRSYEELQFRNRKNWALIRTDAVRTCCWAEGGSQVDQKAQQVVWV